jgi:hypothetical protein
MTAQPPCFGCGSKRRERSACPGCGRVVCQACGEAPSLQGYASCCDIPAPAAAQTALSRRLSHLRGLQRSWRERAEADPVSASVDALTAASALAEALSYAEANAAACEALTEKP